MMSMSPIASARFFTLARTSALSGLSAWADSSYSTYSPVDWPRSFARRAISSRTCTGTSRIVMVTTAPPRLCDSAIVLQAFSIAQVTPRAVVPGCLP